MFEKIFISILEIAEQNGFLALEQIYIDSTHIKASANKKKYIRKTVEVEAKKYQSQLNEAVNKDRREHGKKPLLKNEKSKQKEIVESTTDKESVMFYKTEKERCFAYLAHTAFDDNNFIIDFDVTPENVHDSVAFENVYKNVMDKYSKDVVITAVVLLKLFLILMYFRLCLIKDL